MAASLTHQLPLEQHTQTDALFFSTDLSCTSPDEQCVITYVSMFLSHYSASHEVSAPRVFGTNSSLSVSLQEATYEARPCQLN